MKISTLLIAASLVAAAGSANAANLIVNGGFNNGGTVAAPGGGFDEIGTGSTAMTGWTVTSGNVDWIQGYWQSADGDGYSVDLNGDTPGAIAQTINTVAGQSYQITFDLSANPDSTVDTTRIAVVGANGTIGSADYTLTSANSKANMLWQGYTLDFTATSAATTISFASGNNSGDDCCYGAALDNVAVAAVPEPATWALSIVGVGLLGMALRRPAKRALTRAA